MCGLCGVIFFSENKFDELKSFGEKLSINLEHRGPDAQGFLYNKIGLKSLEN